MPESAKLLAAIIFCIAINVMAARRRQNSRRKQELDEQGNAIFEEQDILEDILSEYDSRVRPKGQNSSWSNTGGPVIVKVNMLLRSISKIDDVNMEYSAQITFREEWVDGRLNFKDRGYKVRPGKQLPSFLVLPPNSEIWMPDSFFQNEKQARKHNIDKPNVLIRIYTDGAILYSVRISLVLSCPMDLRNYPMDSQTCVLDVASYAYTSTDIKYIWKPVNPIQMKDQVRNSLPSFELTSANTSYCTSSTTTGEYSCLRTTLKLKRQFSYYLLQLYIPSSMLVIVSWVSFWLDRSAVPARVTLGVTTLLTMTTQSNGINAKLPPVSYTKAIDIWIGVCLALIFGALLEFACVTYVGDKDLQKRKRSNHANALSNAQAILAARRDTNAGMGQQETSLLLAPNLRMSGAGMQLPQQQGPMPPNHYRGMRRPTRPGLDDDETLDSLTGRLSESGFPPVISELNGTTQLLQHPKTVSMLAHKHSNAAMAPPSYDHQENPLLRSVPPHILAANYSQMGPNYVQNSPPIAYYPYGMETAAPPMVYDMTQVKPTGWVACANFLIRPFKKAIRQVLSREKDRSKKIDYCSRFCFPLFFIVFNISYWWIYK